MRRTIISLLGLAVLVSALAVPALGQSNNIADIVISVSSTDGPDDNPNDYDILLAAILADEALTAAVTGTTDLTVLAPIDKAFLRLTGQSTEADAAAWLDDTFGLGSDALRDIVLYHVVSGASLDTDAVFFTDYDQGKKVTMANGDDIKVRFLKVVDGTGNRVNPRWPAMDIAADNGMIHTIKEVLLPPAK